MNRRTTIVLTGMLACSGLANAQIGFISTYAVTMPTRIPSWQRGTRHQRHRHQSRGSSHRPRRQPIYSGFRAMV